MHIAFLTMKGLVEGPEDDGLAAHELRRRGHVVDWVVWDRPGVEWGTYDGVVVRSPFDYIYHVERFVQTLESIGAATVLLNGPRWMRWNVDKRYLLDLSKEGVAVVPTRCVDALTLETVEAARLDLGGGDLIAKPTVGASGYGVQRLPLGEVEELLATSVSRQHPWLLQPLIPSVLEDGELSLMFFDGMFSHGVQKVPRRGDFLVQEEHGGSTRSAAAPADALQVAQEALDVSARCVGTRRPPLYGRIDLVQGAEGGYQVMEVEVIEPQLFLGYDDNAAAWLADAVERRLDGSSLGAPD